MSTKPKPRPTCRKCRAALLVPADLCGLCIEEEEYMTRQEQAREALDLANATRFAIARLRRELRALPTSESMKHAAELLHDPPQHVLAMRAHWFLTSVKRVGETKANRMLQSVDVQRGGRRVRDLSPRQRSLLAGRLEQLSVHFAGLEADRALEGARLRREAA